MKNTFSADVNEICFGYSLLGNTWNGFVNSSEAKKTLSKRKKQIKQKEVDDQVGRAQSMSEEVHRWTKSNQYGKIKNVWWTARPNILSEAINENVDSKKNPTDVLIKFSNNEFLGISAKSTKGKNDIGFKNPGIGTLSSKLGIDLSSYVKESETKMIKKYSLPKSQKDRKKYIRSNSKIQKETTSNGKEILNNLRNTLYDFYKNNFDNNQIKNHIQNDWMDSSSKIYPRYIKVTGKGVKGNYSATVQDPLDNKKIKALNKKDIKISKVGTDSIGISADSTKIMKIRFKYESEKLASTVKLSGDPWN